MLQRQDAAPEELLAKLVEVGGPWLGWWVGRAGRGWVGLHFDFGWHRHSLHCTQEAHLTPTSCVLRPAVPPATRRAGRRGGGQRERA